MQEDAVRPVRPVVGIERVGGGGELAALVAAPKEGGKVETVVARRGRETSVRSVRSVHLQVFQWVRTDAGFRLSVLSVRMSVRRSLGRARGR